MTGLPETVALAACNFASDRSVAILFRGEKIGSGVLIQGPRRRLFVATAGHCIADGPRRPDEACATALDPTRHLRRLRAAELDDIELRPRGANLEFRARALAGWVHNTLDLGALELEFHPSIGQFVVDPATDIHHLSTDDHHDWPALVQGFPAQNVIRHPSDLFDVASVALGTLFLPSQGSADGLSAVEWPPKDGSLDEAGLPRPSGISGGGIWLFPKITDSPLVWTPNRARLVGLSISWVEARRELWFAPIREWLEVVTGLDSAPVL